MAEKELIIDPGQIDLDRVVADTAAIRRANPQRFEMEQLTAVVHTDPEQHICVGYLDLKPDAFWARGHMPGMPLMPGVLMCEAAAQLSSYYVVSTKLMSENAILGFGGLDGVRFRDPVLPGARLVVAIKLTKMRKDVMMVFRFQEFVDRVLVCEGELRGVALPLDRLRTGETSK
ncbi:MAG: beta-hydroxyacyl-ACP dehydratase [Planctomycetes bacterium]|nr:beta-hydroxyacyl-ACP dehydratase [Planctomycetota bacterium]